MASLDVNRQHGHHDPDSKTPRFYRALARSFIGRFWGRLNIGLKLMVAFSALMTFIGILVGVSFVASLLAVSSIRNTAQVRVPTALAAAQAQANLLRMQADLRGYLALGDRQYWDAYKQDSAAFAGNLSDLNSLVPRLSIADREQLFRLEAAYQRWAHYPDELIALHDDQLAREPAYSILATQGLRLGGTALLDASKLIDSIAAEQQIGPTAQTIAQLADVARFQGSFSAMLSGLRGYVTTRNRAFRSEYEANFDLNRIAWDRLASERADMSPAEQQILDDIGRTREEFLKLPDQMFTIIEGDHWREDLYLFRTQALPLSDDMLRALGDLTTGQERKLVSELNEGRTSLENANLQMLVCGFLALLFSIAMAFFLRTSIAGPVRRLTRVAEQVRGGDLTVRAHVTSNDEVGILAETFNRMTAQLRHTLAQIRKEKRRADDLLNVVIPIGAQLSNEKDFDRLLENILLQAKNFCGAGAGTLYLRSHDADELKHVIVRDDRLHLELGGTTGKPIPFKPIRLRDEAGELLTNCGLAARSALEGRSINLPDAVQVGDFDFAGIADAAEVTGERTSFLAIPLKSAEGEVAGVLQLTDARDPETGETVPFDPNLQQMMESYSLLAVAALQAYVRERRLQQQIQELKIEIDEVNRQKQVQEIVESDFFQDLQTRARAMRERQKRPSTEQANQLGS